MLILLTGYLIIGFFLLLIAIKVLKEKLSFLDVFITLFVYPGILLISIIAFCFYSFIQMIDSFSRKEE